LSAIMTTRLRSPLTRKAGTSDPISESGKPRVSPCLKDLNPEQEPLEDSVRVTEAPESWQDCHVEAPDAGKGESHAIEGEFTHGRSRS
jgi:hypothetical protein